jgi:hypothetical protein
MTIVIKFPAKLIRKKKKEEVKKYGRNSKSAATVDKEMGVWAYLMNSDWGKNRRKNRRNHISWC